jgi:CSLREA domain-containing protein
VVARRSCPREWESVVVGTACVVLALCLCASAAGKTYKPTTSKDHVQNGCSKKDCTLREAISAANAHSGADKVVLKGGKRYKLSIPGQDEHDNATGDLNVLDALTISHKGKKPATVNANGVDRAFRTEAKTTLKGVVITGGNPHGGGGGLLDVAGKLKIVGCTITKNRATNAGGIEASGSGDGPESVVIVDSTISSNSTTEREAGGIAIYSGKARISESTIYGNRANPPVLAGEGGGIVVAGKATLENVTVAGNSANDFGGGIQAMNGGEITLNAVTVAYNRGDSDNDGNGGAGGIGQFNGGSVTLRNSLVAANTAFNGTGPDCSPADPGTIVSDGHNLIADTTDCSLTKGPGDLFDLALTKVKIGKLAKNGGPTQTVALKKGSKAIGHAGKDAPAKDQRGVKRDAHPDIGAYERG